MAILSQGTRFYAQDDIVHIVPSTSKETPEGKEIHGVYSATVHYKIDDVVRAELELYIAHEAVDGVLIFFATDPNTGEFKRLKYVEWEDGSVFEC